MCLGIVWHVAWGMGHGACGEWLGARSGDPVPICECPFKCYYLNQCSGIALRPAQHIYEVDIYVPCLIVGSALQSGLVTSNSPLHCSAECIYRTPTYAKINDHRTASENWPHFRDAQTLSLLVSQSLSFSASQCLRLSLGHKEIYLTIGNFWLILQFMATASSGSWPRGSGMCHWRHDQKTQI